MSIKIYNNNAREGRPEYENTHENEQFSKLSKLLIDKYGSERSPYVLIPNLCDCDAVFVKQDALIILEFKHYGGVLTMVHDKDYVDPDERDNNYISDKEKKWMIGDVEVKGGASNHKGVPKNPFKQCRINKKNLTYKLNRFFERSSAPLGLISAVVVFDQNIQFNNDDISPKAQTWFKITDMEHIVETLDNITNKPDVFHYTEEDVIEFPSAFKLSKEWLKFPRGKQFSCSTRCDQDYQLFVDGIQRYWFNKGSKSNIYPPDKPTPITLVPSVYLFKFQSVSNPECIVSKLYRIDSPTQIVASLRKVEEELASLEYHTDELTNRPLHLCIAGVDFEMCNIDGGTNSDASNTIANFMLAKYAVTKKLWNAVAPYGGLPPCNAPTDDTPVTDVSWEECMAFIKTLNTLSNDVFRMPTSSEWKYAAQGGNKKQHSIYAGNDDATKVAWFRFNSDSIKPVGQLAPNSMQLYDMCGNVWEYCSDLGFDNPEARVACGGSWLSPLDECKIESQAFLHKDFGNHVTGFRLAMTRISSIPLR